MGSPPAPTYPSGDVRAKLNFFHPPADGAEAINVVSQQGLPDRNWTDDTNNVLIRDLRGRESDVVPDRDGVAVIQDHLTWSPDVFSNDDSIKERYYPDLEKLLLRMVPGSHTIIIFDHTVRRADPEASRNPVTRVHIDQTASSMIQRIRKHVPGNADELLAGRYRIVNVWKSLNLSPVESFPLAFALSPSVSDEDLVTIHHQYPSGYRGQTAGVKFSRKQEWFYLSGMCPDEQLLLQCFQGQGLQAEGIRGARLAHTAFEDPRTRQDAEPRESIEVRALVFGP